MTADPHTSSGSHSTHSTRRWRSRIASFLLVPIFAFLISTASATPASSQVEGVGNGSANWNGWVFDYGVESGFDGLSLTGVSYEGTDIAHRISLPVMNVYYQNNACGPYADRLGGTIQGLYTNEFVMNGERWLELAIEDHIGAYVIYQSYYFSESGTLDAHMFSKGLQCYTYHEHLPFWRFDFDVEGTSGDEILRRLSDGTLSAETNEFNLDANDAANHEWYVRDRPTGTTIRLNFDDGTYNMGGAIVPETSYPYNKVFGRQYKSGEVTWSGGPSRTLGFNEGESISDVVLWYTGFMPHSAEEGTQLWHSTGVRVDIVADPTVEPPNECAGLTREAEDGELFGAMVVGSDPAASGGSYVHVPDGTGHAWSFGSANRAEYCFTVEEAGLYTIGSKVNALDNRSDSFWVTVDGQPTDGILWDVRPITGTYIGDEVADRNGQNPVVVDLGVGEHTIVVHQREDGARLDSLSLEPYGTGNASCTGGLRKEAEDGALFGAMAVGNDPAASGGSYIHVPDGTGHAWSFGSGNKAEYCFTVNQAGSYVIETGVNALDNRSDSFWVTVDGQPTDGILWDARPITGSYITANVADRNGDNPVVVDLGIGEHTIVVHQREDGARLDSIALKPYGGGNTSCAGGLSKEAEDGALFGSMVVGNDPAASGGSYIHVPDGAGHAWSFGSGNKAEYCFTVSQAGSYILSADVNALDNRSDSFWVTVNSQPTDGILWDVRPITASYITDNVADRDGQNPVVVDLGAGEHTVTVYQREDGARLDRLTLTRQ